MQNSRIARQFTNVVLKFKKFSNTLQPYAIHGLVVAVMVSSVTLSSQLGGLTGQNVSRVVDSAQDGVKSNTSVYVAASLADGLGVDISNGNGDEGQAALNGQDQLITGNDTYIPKVSAVATDSASRGGVTTYTVKEGDSVESVAANFNITTRTLRWANDLTDNDTLSVGDKLIILPVNGILYKVKADDTPEKLANRYGSNAVQIISFNDAEIDGLKSGDKIVIPDGILPESERPRAPAPQLFSTSGTYAGVFSSTYYSGGSTIMATVNDYANNSGYARGWCTDWAYYRAAQLGNNVGTNWGNAISWAAHARAQGFYVGPQPKVGAVVYWPGRNHVGVVEEVSSDGSRIKYSDMNGLAGRNVAAKTNNWIPASSYQYIYR